MTNLLETTIEIEGVDIPCEIYYRGGTFKRGQISAAPEHCEPNDGEEIEIVSLGIVTTGNVVDYLFGVIHKDVSFLIPDLKEKLIEIVVGALD